jgi:plastocyanin
MKKTLSFYLALFLVAFLTSSALAYQEGSVSNGGSISGKITFSGKAPAPRMNSIDKEFQAVCGKKRASQDLLVGKSGGIQNVVVRITGIKSGKKWDIADEITIDQKGCKFAPHVTIFKPGATLVMLNPDGITHNMHTFSRKNPAINKAQPKFKKEMKIEGKIKTPETIKLSCDIHKKWMVAWIIVADSPYIAVTDVSGSFKIDNVPAGNYIVDIWQEKLGSQTAKVSVKGGSDAKVSVSYK